MNGLIYSKIPYEADNWIKVDVLLDWQDHVAAFFLNNALKATEDFYTRDRDV